MYPNQWATSTPPLPPPLALNNPSSSNYENNTHSFPFYPTSNAMQSFPMNQQNSLTRPSLNPAAVMTQQFQSNTLPNAIGPTIIKWPEWNWELWHQHFQQQWHQQNVQMSTTMGQPPPPPMPQSQPLQPPQPPMSLQQPYFDQKNTAMQPHCDPLQMKRSMEPELQIGEKKIKMDTSLNKKENELNVDIETFEEKFIKWEGDFLKWKEQNKNHPDKVQYEKYENKWLGIRDGMKQKCDLLKKRREAKLAEKKEAAQIEENQKQRLFYNQMMLNSVPSNNSLNISHRLPNMSSSLPLSSENQIPGLDLVGNNENGSQMIQNVSKLIPNQKGPIQTPDDKPFNFPKTNNLPTMISEPVKLPLNNNGQTMNSNYPNSPYWSNYNNSQPFYNQKPPDINNHQMFDTKDDVDYRRILDSKSSSENYSNSYNTSNARRQQEVSFTKTTEIYGNPFNAIPDSQAYNRNVDGFNTSYNRPPNNFEDYNQSVNSNFNRPSDRLNNISYPYKNQTSLASMNTALPKPPSLMSLNVTKPLLEKPGKTDVAPNRFESDWNIADEEDNPEDEYMEAHKKFSSEPYEDLYNEDQYLNNQQGNNKYNDDRYPRGPESKENNQEDYVKQFNQSFNSQMMKNPDTDYSKPQSQWNHQNNDKIPSYGRQLPRNDDYDYYNRPQGNLRNVDDGYQKGGRTQSRNIDEEYINDFDRNKNNIIPNRGNFGPPSRGNYGSARGGRFGNNYMSKSNNKWNDDFKKDISVPLPIIDDCPPVTLEVKKPSIEDIPPIDPVKLFDYRHLSALKVIPGLSKETIVPVKIVDYNHGGKRLLPWQDRGFSRRNNTNTRDLNEKECTINENTSTDKIIDTLHDIKSSETNLTTLDNKIKSLINDVVKDKTVTVMPIKNIEEKEEKPQPVEIPIKIISPPSPPKMPKPKVEPVARHFNRHMLPIETLLCPPGRANRPEKIVIILRGLPGSGKSHVAKLIKEKELAMGGQAPRILSLDDYFMTEVTKIEIDPETNKKIEKKVMEYEHDSANESLYRTSFIKAFKKKVMENYFSFYILDAINNKVTYYKDILDIAKTKGFTPYVVELESDVDSCIKNNIHNRTSQEIINIANSWVKTPHDQILLNIQSLLHPNNEVEMEIVSDVEMDLEKNEDGIENTENVQSTNDGDFEEEDVDVMKLLSCKWVDNIPQEEKMNRLDGLCKKKPENSIKEWLQIPETDYSITEQEPKDGKKRVRWADIEEQRQQEKMRAIGFVVGQTDWNRMLGQDQGESKLTQTKYI
ncbi:uncharacterized protein LOC126840529 isoform X2 [Adelges cooleyi]|uniref:uncharacterized protein LOC126840529 isoform X2 n=1 Tax=Adelges cooleyi TaxID=133065 RepID=UPI00217F4139|nr:uncharacterized protein LOC126840529 isoform X2 [Adelges cooleyi]